jgi:hypothetical protein
MVGKQVCLAFDFFIEPDCSLDIVCSDVIQLLKPGAESGFEPDESSTRGLLSTRLGLPLLSPSGALPFNFALRNPLSCYRLVGLAQSLLNFTAKPRIMGRGLVRTALPRGGIGPTARKEVRLGRRPGGSIDSNLVRADLMQDGDGFAGIAEGAQFAAVGSSQCHAFAGSWFGGDEEFPARSMDRHRIAATFFPLELRSPLAARRQSLPSSQGYIKHRTLRWEG